MLLRQRVAAAAGMVIVLGCLVWMLMPFQTSTRPGRPSLVSCGVPVAAAVNGERGTICQTAANRRVTAAGVVAAVTLVGTVGSVRLLR